MIEHSPQCKACKRIQSQESIQTTFKTSQAVN